MNALVTHSRELPFTGLEFFILNYSTDENACFAFSINPLPLTQV